MGFATLIDIVGSTIIAGLLVLTLMHLNDSAIENNFLYGGEVLVQENLVEVVELLEHDFRKIGYCADWEKIADPSKSIIMADSNRIDFLTDVDDDSDIDTLHYYLGDKNELTGTPNPNDRMLYRVVNSANPMGANLGITQFEITYFDAIGDTINFPISVPGEIFSMQIDVRVENTVDYDQQYTSVFWRQIRLSTQNIKNR